MNKYFTYDPENNAFETYATFEEQAKAAEEIIKSYLDADNSWPEEVTGIIYGIVTGRATKCDVVNRPEKLDDDGYDEEGQYWPEEIDYFCNYEMAAI